MYRPIYILLIGYNTYQGCRSVLALSDLSRYVFSTSPCRSDHYSMKIGRSYNSSLKQSCTPLQNVQQNKQGNTLSLLGNYIGRLSRTKCVRVTGIRPTQCVSTFSFVSAVKDDNSRKRKSPARRVTVNTQHQGSCEHSTMTVLFVLVNFQYSCLWSVLYPVGSNSAFIPSNIKI